MIVQGVMCVRKGQADSARYYLILGYIVGKAEGDNCFIRRQGRWVEDSEYMIMDRLMGYDPSEPTGSPYGIGNSDIVDEIEEITFEMAVKYIGEQDEHRDKH